MKMMIEWYRDGRFGSKVDQISPKSDKSGAFRGGAKCTEIWSEKAPDLFVPFGANLTHFGAKSTISTVLTSGVAIWILLVLELLCENNYFSLGLICPDKQTGLG